MLDETRLGGWDASRATLAALRMDRGERGGAARFVRAGRRRRARWCAALAAVSLLLRCRGLAAVRGDLRAARVLPHARRARDPRAPRRRDRRALSHPAVPRRARQRQRNEDARLDRGVPAPTG